MMFIVSTELEFILLRTNPEFYYEYYQEMCFVYSSSQLSGVVLLIRFFEHIVS